MNLKVAEWMSKDLEDKDLTNELNAISSNSEEINDRFYTELEFGTGGIRGVIGAGTNRMNIYTVRKATQGLANYIKENYADKSVAISYDSRIKSDLFAKEAARVLAANKIKVYIYSELMPTPCLSFAVRELNCTMGIMVTASHNPAKYNGYKAYGPDGCQIANEMADAVLEKIKAVNEFNDVAVVDFDEALKNGLISYIKNEVIEAYYNNVLAQSINKGIVEKSNFRLVYTPLNGAGNKPVREVLKRIGIKDISIVPEQENPDGNFTTCPFPNPEIKEALQLGLELCKKTNSDLLLATDPDCDRVGIAVPYNGDYKLLTGNEVGCLLLHYIASQRKALGTMPKNPIVVKTIVTTNLIDEIASEYGVEVNNVLTGFKYIGELIGNLESKNETERYILGFEESYGYLCGSYVRDKDAVVASMLICEMAAFYASKGKNLVDVLNSLYEKYGYYLCTQKNFAFEGEKGMEDMSAIMNSLRENPLKKVGEVKVKEFDNYKDSVSKDLLTGEEKSITLPSANVIAFKLEDGCKAVIRPSGTEPKIKIYYFVLAENEEKARKREESLNKDFVELLNLK